MHLPKSKTNVLRTNLFLLHKLHKLIYKLVYVHESGKSGFGNTSGGRKYN